MNTGCHCDCDRSRSDHPSDILSFDSKLLIIGVIAVLNIIGNKTDSMTTYIINYKEYGRDWSRTTYTTPETVTKEYLISFFGLEECEDYNIEETTN